MKLGENLHTIYILSGALILTDIIRGLSMANVCFLIRKKLSKYFIIYFGIWKKIYETGSYFHSRTADNRNGIARYRGPYTLGETIISRNYSIHNKQQAFNQ